MWLRIALILVVLICLPLHSLHAAEDSSSATPQSATPKLIPLKDALLKIPKADMSNLIGRWQAVIPDKILKQRPAGSPKPEWILDISKDKFSSTKNGSSISADANYRANEANPPKNKDARAEGMVGPDGKIKQLWVILTNIQPPPTGDNWSHIDFLVKDDNHLRMMILDFFIDFEKTP